MLNKTIYKTYKCLFLIVMGLLLTVLPLQAHASVGTDSIEAEKALIEVFEYLKEVHISNPQPDQLLKGAVQGMLDTLDDPHTVYLSKDELQQLTMDLDGDYAGIGVYLAIKESYPEIQEVFSDSPAMKAGLQAGDLILKANDFALKGLPLYQAVSLIKGPPGSDLTLVIKRGELPQQTVRLTRGLLNISTVVSEKPNESTGYIAVRSFGDETAEQFKNHLNQLLSQKISGLIIDLRDNAGGYVNSATEIAEIFLEQGKTIVITQHFDGSKQTVKSYERFPLKIPLVVLVNQQSASASELLSGALRDNDVATLVGENTYGKGTAQSIIPMETGGALKITTAKYITPNGNVVDGRGLSPDYNVRTRELQTIFALNLLGYEVTPIVFNKNSGEVTIDERVLHTGRAPLYKDGHYYLPLRFTLEALGYTVHWDQHTGTITAQKQSRVLTADLQGGIKINNNPVKQRVTVINGVSYIPAEAIDHLGYLVKDSSESITITTD